MNFLVLSIIFTLLPLSCRSKPQKISSYDSNSNNDGSHENPSGEKIPEELNELLKDVTIEKVNALSGEEQPREGAPTNGDIGSLNDHLNSPNAITACEGGFIDGNSGKNITYETNPWFLTKAKENALSSAPLTETYIDTIYYCIDSLGSEHDSHFSIKVSAIEAIIDTAFRDWINYIKTLETNLKPLKDSSLYNPNFWAYDAKGNPVTTIPASHKNLQLTKNFVKMSSCEPTSDQKPSLKFVLGRNPISVAGKSIKLQNHFAFSARLAYDAQSMKSEGLIWISPDLEEIEISQNNSTVKYKEMWRKENALLAIITHELGHIFGFSHDSIEVMKATFPLVFLSQQKTSSSAQFFQAPERATWIERFRPINPTCYRATKEPYYVIRSNDPDTPVSQKLENFLAALGVKSQASEAKYDLLCLAITNTEKNPTRVDGAGVFKTSKNEKSEFTGVGFLLANQGKPLNYRVPLTNGWITNPEEFLYLPAERNSINMELKFFPNKRVFMNLEKIDFGEYLIMTGVIDKTYYNLSFKYVGKISEIKAGRKNSLNFENH